MTVEVTVKYHKKKQKSVTMHTVANDSAYRIAFSLSEVMFYVSVICIYIVDLYIYIIIFSPSSPELVLKKILFGYFNSAKVVHISLP